MTITLNVPESLESLFSPEINEYQWFLQACLNRLMVGGLRYGIIPMRNELYLKQITLELKAYRRNGNFEHLINAANYCYLESRAPQNKKFHFDPTAASATREELDKLLPTGW